MSGESTGAVLPEPETLNGEPLYRTWWKVWPFPRCCLPCNVVLHPCRAAVSRKKTRFRQDGFDLDLTYVTDRIIVHGFPAVGVEHIYRNPRSEVKRLLDKYHCDHYKIYNFTSEPGRQYPSQLFQGRVERYPFADHTCPPLKSVVEFCEDAKAWLDTDESNVVSLHCKAGKGRAGIMAACLMVRMGQTADAAVQEYDAKRAYDNKGLTVVNQRKWVFMYERVVKEVWGLKDRIGMVPGEDPDLQAPSSKTTSLREISVQMLPVTEGKRDKTINLRSLMCTLYQQRPEGKKLLYTGRMVRVTPEEDEPELVFAAALPRSPFIEGTFQVVIGAAMGPACSQRDVLDLWWNTTFLEQDGGTQVFELAEMDVWPARLIHRLKQAGVRITLRYTRPDGESPPRRTPMSADESPEPPDSPKKREGREESEEAGQGNPCVEPRSLPHPSQEEMLPLRTESSLRSLPPPSASGDTTETSASTSTRAGNANANANANAGHANASAGIAYIAIANTGNANGVPDNDEEIESTTYRRPAGDAKSVVSRTDPGGASTGDLLVTALAEPVRDDFFLKNAETSGANLQESGGGKSPSLPGPSPAGGSSPAWTFEGRTSSTRPGELNGNAAEWRQRRMWSSGPIDDVSTSTPLDGAAEKSALPSHETRLGLKDQRHMLCKRSSQDLGGSTSVSLGPTGSTSSQAAPEPDTKSAGAPPVPVVATGSALEPPQAGAGVRAHGQRHEGYGYPPYETESDSDDQVAVSASAFGGGGAGTAGNGSASELLAEKEQHQYRPAARPIGGSMSSRSSQWVVEMEMAFEQERRRWLEHRRCLETELDWALAARARAEARSEEDSARVEVLEKRLSAWRGEYSMIEQDVKQAHALLEMSLSGLVSAENALKRWKDQVPAKVYEDIMACLTTGDNTFSRSRK